MKHNSKIVDTYTPNKQVMVRVTNTPKYQDDKFIDYDRTVTIKIMAGRDNETLKFESQDDIAKYIETVDFEEAQQELPLK